VGPYLSSKGVIPIGVKSSLNNFEGGIGIPQTKKERKPKRKVPINIRKRERRSGATSATQSKKKNNLDGKKGAVNEY